MRKEQTGISLDVLLIGVLGYLEDGSVDVQNTSSTSVLIRTPEHNIVVDTGAKFMKAGIKTSFKQIGIFPDEVDILVLTHYHVDHVGNVDMFPNARIIIHTGGEGYEGAEELDFDELELCEGVKIVHLPGHTMDSCSVFVKQDRNYVIAGDVCPLKENLMGMMPPKINVDSEAALSSLEKIAEFADVLIPGHGGPYLTQKGARSNR